MEVILLQDIEGLGKKYQIKKVKDGYARNYLIPNKLAIPATEANIRWAKRQKEILQNKAEKHLKEIQELASRLDGQEVVFTVKIGERGQLYESITQSKIAKKLKEMGFEVKKSQVMLEKPLKEIGEWPVKINLEEGLEAEIRVIINPEEKPEAEE